MENTAYSFKKLTEVDVIEETTESTHVLAEVDGEVKRVAIDKVGSSDGVSSWNDLEDKPFGEETVKQTIVPYNVYGEFTDYYRGGRDCSIWGTWDGDYISLDYGNYNVLLDDTIYENVPCVFLEDGDCYCLGDTTFTDYPFYILGVKFPDGFGVYVNDTENTTHIIEVYREASSIAQLDEKFIPDTIARVSDISGAGKTTVLDNDSITQEQWIEYAKTNASIIVKGQRLNGNGQTTFFVKAVNAYECSYSPADDCCGYAESYALNVRNGEMLIASCSITSTQYNEIIEAWNSL